MALTFGFYDSVAFDRAYNARQISSIFDGIIVDGVFSTIGNSLMVYENSGMALDVGSGRAWFNHTWTFNDSALSITLDNAHGTLNRIDLIVLEVNEEIAVRANSIKKITGTPATNPVKPLLTNTSTIHQYTLGEIYVEAATTSISQENITNHIGTPSCPFVTGPLSFITTEELLAQWEAQFIVWFDDMKDHLAGDLAGALQLQINDIKGDLNPPVITLLTLKTHNHEGGNGNSINTNGLAAGAVTSSKLGTGAVTAGKIDSGGVSASAQLADLVVSESKLGNLAVTAGKIAAGAVSTTKIAENAVDDTRVGNRVPQYYRRKGGHPSHWATSGSTVYTPGYVRFQGGADSMVLPSGLHEVTGTVIFPVSFSYTPLAFMQNKTFTYHDVIFNVTAISETQFDFHIYKIATVGADIVIHFMWKAEGPE